MHVQKKKTENVDTNYQMKENKRTL